MKTRNAPGAWLAAALLLATACAHGPAPALSQRVREGRCEDVASFLRAHRRGPPVASQLRRAITLPLSYAVVGTTYTVEAVAVVGGGLVGAVILCSPIAMVEGALHGSGTFAGECVRTMADAFLEDAKLPGAGKALDKATRRWRCADTTPISEDLRAVAECYARRNGPGDLERARSQLAVLAASERVLECASRDERRNVERATAWVAGLLEAADPR